MANWVYVENNEVVEQHDLLPKNWKNISGLNLAVNDLPFLKSVGWYSVTKQHELYDESTHYISDYDYEIRENDVLEIITLTEREPVPEEEFFNKKYRFIEELRNRRNKLLIDSDWSQLQDVQNKFDEITKNKWIIYRQSLRDIVQVYSENEITNIDQVEWPSLELQN
jgi:predicted metal-dependent hydrolase